MAKLPQIKRLVTEDFMDQKSWISRLFMPLNTFMESVITAFNRNLTLTENLSADIKTVLFTTVPTGTSPVNVAWTLKHAPVAIMIGQISRLDAAAFTLTVAPAIQWSWTTSGLQITNLIGVTPSSAVPYNLTLVCFTG